MTDTGQVRTDEVRVSVCIPTCNRPDMLRQCIESALAQTMPPFEIVVGDDSRDDRSERVVAELARRSPVPIRYRRNVPPLGQAANVQSIFERARGNWLLLIHDDDWILPTAVASLTRPICMGQPVDAVFGDQAVADADGTLDEEASAALNRSHHRTPERAGLQPDPVWSAVVQQFPNNGWLVRRELAVTVGYDDGLTKDGCDFSFGVRLALAGGRFWYEPGLVAVYRKSETSVSRGSSGATTAFDTARTVWRYRNSMPRDSIAVRHIRDNCYRAVVWCGLQRRHRIEALKWALHPRWGLGSAWLGAKGPAAILALLAPAFRQKLRGILKA